MSTALGIAALALLPPLMGLLIHAERVITEAERLIERWRR